MNSTSHPTLILGGGFVGLFTALHLAHQSYRRPMILIEPRDRFVFKPLLYELLTGELHLDHICPPYARLFANSPVQHVQDTVEMIDLHHRQVTLTSGQSYHYGSLVLALGSQTSYFNTPGAVEHTVPFSTAMDAMHLQTRLKTCLEKARSISDPEAQQQPLTVAILGAGPAGVELACTLADILPVWYDDLGGSINRLRIVLINRSGEILKGDINSRLRQTAQQSFTQRTIPIELVLNATVTEIQSDGVVYQQQGQTEFLPAATMVWTAGSAPHSLLQTLAVAPDQRDARGRLQVMPTLQLPGFPEVFVGGDCAYVPDHPQPPTAQVAYQQGKAIADNLSALARNEPALPAAISLRGTLMKLGIGEGAANLFNRVELKGEVGHLIRQATYLELLPTPLHNFRNTTEWLKDELLQHHQARSINPRHQSRTPVLAGMSALLASGLIAVPLIWRAAHPDQFRQQMSGSGIPALIDRMVSPPN